MTARPLHASSPPRRALVILGAGLLGLLFVGCQSGPQTVPEGTYRLLADSSTTSPTTADSLAVSSSRVTLTATDATSTVLLGAATSEYTLCPPSGRGPARSLASPLTINGTSYARPALFGDCGQTKPARVTIIDLDSYNDGATKMPFNRWAEFCDTRDPDCS